MRFSFGNEWRSLFSIVVFRGRKVRGVPLSFSTCPQCDDGVCFTITGVADSKCFDVSFANGFPPPHTTHYYVPPSTRLAPPPLYAI